MIKLLIILTLFNFTTHALKGKTDLSEFKKTAVVLKGRVTPLDTFSKNILRQLSGKSSYEGMSSIEWLADTLFRPDKAASYRVFLISNPQVTGAIGIKGSGKGRDRYSFRQLLPGADNLDRLVQQIIRKKDSSRSILEQELLILYNRLLIFKDLQNSFRFAVPSELLTLNNLSTIRDVKQYTYLEFFSVRDKLNSIDGEEKQKAGRLMLLHNEFPAFHTSSVIPIIPVKDSDWLAPWEFLSRKMSSKEVPPLISLLNDMAASYRADKSEEFNRALSKFNSGIDKISAFNRQKLQYEVNYNSVDPFYKSQFFYGFAALILMASGLFKKKRPLITAGMILTATGLLLHIWGMVIRYLITGRPPVTNLYETFVFTGFITVILGIILYFKPGGVIPVTGGNAIALIMMLIAGKYSADSDTMGVLVAVLDSNFWLAAHVITIILGYAGIILSGFIGHVWLVSDVLGKRDQSVFKAIYSTQIFGLIFTFTGTVLGGVWADQSWGRFWGWDPKENGALAVLIFSAILFHARKAGIIKERGFAAGAVAGTIVVALAWFGVNLLGVGLHSYGFTTGVAIPLFTYIIIELTFLIFITLPGLNRKK